MIIILVFSTKKLRNVGGDLGAAVRNFKDGMKDGEASTHAGKDDTGRIIEADTKDKRG